MRCSVVVTIVDGGEQLRRCLVALAPQAKSPAVEVLIPCDDTVGDLAALRGEFPGFRFIPLGRLPTVRTSGSPAGRHELIDQRRAAGLAAATGDIVALLEDRGVPRPEWVATLLDLHTRLSHPAIGGAIEWAGQGALSWAVYACDFGRSRSAQPEGPREFLSSCNLSYKRPAVEATRPLWRERYHETQVHDRLRSDGGVLWFAPAAVVEQARSGLRLAPLLAERFAWGRRYAVTRVARASPSKRGIRAVTALLLPALLYLRILRRHAPVTPGRLVMATPALLLLLAAWSAGEGAGYLTGEP
jgi:GT2 family glycosyltransferase